MVDKRTSCYAARLAAFSCPQKHWKALIFRGALKFLFEFRNAIVHGYVFPISGTSSGIFLTKKPREVVTFNSSDLELISFCKRIYDKIFDFITEGWKSFSVDELGQPREIDQHNI
jgi:hypothetical protein